MRNLTEFCVVVLNCESFLFINWENFHIERSFLWIFWEIVSENIIFGKTFLGFNDADTD